MGELVRGVVVDGDDNVPVDLPENDRNIIVTVHYYSPIEFTHQGLRCLGRAIPVGAS